MIRIALINMPFGGLHIPSLALTQLESILSRNFGEQISIDILYVNHDFGKLFGTRLYQFMSDNGVTTVTGLTDWLFRQVAFPELPDNQIEYLARYKKSLRLTDDELDFLLTRRALMNDTFEELIDLYALDSYSIVGFTSMFDQSVASFAMARKLKERRPEILTILGGASCELLTGEIIAKRIDSIDFVFSGPALKSFVQFISNYLRGDMDACHHIRGVYSRKNLDWAMGKKLNQIGEELDINDRIPLDYTSFLSSLSAKLPELSPELFFETSRGCWWGEKSHCTFCGLNGVTMGYRSMAPERAIEQFNELFSNYKVPLFFAVDNILSKDYFDRVIPYIKVPEGSNVFYETKLLTNEAHMKVLADSGITRIQPGIEALSTTVLKIMRKGTTAFQNIVFLKATLKFNLLPDWNLLIGFPKEPEDVYGKYVADIPFLVHLPAPGSTFPVRFDRYSPYHNTPEEFGLQLEPLDFYSMIYPFSSEELNDFAYFFADRNYDNSYMLNLARWRKKVEVVVGYWNTRWAQADGKIRPELKLIEERHVIYDSRSGEVKEYELSEEVIDVLNCLNQPMGISTLKHRMKELDEETILSCVNQLKENNLLFQEGDSMLSLVC
jgi:ribosomal peptide maturation radical SAM protein 1